MLVYFIHGANLGSESIQTWKLYGPNGATLGSELIWTQTWHKPDGADIGSESILTWGFYGLEAAMCCYIYFCGIFGNSLRFVVIVTD